MKSDVYKLKTWCRGSVGINEHDKSHKQIVDLYNSFRPLPRGYKMTLEDPWCACYVSAASIACGLTDVIPPECSCANMMKLLDAAGAVRHTPDEVPEIGDLVFYDWEDDGRVDHVGIVTDVSDGSYAVTEGNFKDAVGVRRLKPGDKRIKYIYSPAYQDDKRYSDDAVAWAKENKISDCEDIGSPATREQVITMLYRNYLLMKGDNHL